MLSLLLLNFSLLGNIVSTVNLSDTFIPKAEIDLIQVTKFDDFSNNPSQEIPEQKINFDSLSNYKLQIPKPKIKSVVTAPTVEFKPALQGGKITISKINLTNISLAKSSISTIADMDKKMLYAPVVEDKISPDLCSDYGNSYISGHSEPAKSSDKNYPGVNIFSNLHELEVDDIINVTNSKGVQCAYKVTGWDTAITGVNNSVSREIFTNAYFPDTDKVTLTIQTCQKGSATVRLLLRAEKIS